MAVTTAAVDSTFRQGSTGTTSTITGVSFGTASAGRVLTFSFFTNTNDIPSSITIGGVAATIVGNSSLSCALASAVVPSGTSGSIVATFPSSNIIWSLGVIASTGAANATAADTIVNASGASGVIDVPAGGAVIAALIEDSPGSWTGVTNKISPTGATDCHTATFDNSGGALSNRTISYSNASTLVAISLSPSGGGTAYTLTASGGSYAITGTAATLKRSRLLTASAGSYALTGTAATLRVGKKLAADSGSYGITGTTATFRLTRVLGASAGSYGITGTIAALKHSYLLGASAGSYAVTGTAAVLKHGFAIGASSGSYSISGTTVTLRKAWLLGASAGSYAITGTAATLAKVAAYKLTASAGSYAISGTNASLVQSRRLSAAAGSYAISGQAATLIKISNGILVASAGSYAITGQAATLRIARKLSASAGSYAVTGQAAGLRASRTLSAVSGSYSITGTSAALTKSGFTSYTLVAETGSFVLSGQPATLTYLPLPGIRNPLERLKMYTGSMGSVSNREDWIVNISLVGDDGTSFDLTGAEIVTYVCREGRADCPVLSASLNSGIVLTDNYTMQWHFSEDQMAALCPQQYDVFCRVERDDITTQLLAANIAVVDGGPA